MSAILHGLDDRFAMDEMISASDLQEKSVTVIESKLKSSHKLLVTHYRRPVGVLLPLEVFTALIQRYAELEEALEAKETANFIDDRLTHHVDKDQWLTLDQYNEVATKVFTDKARSADEEG